MTERTDIDTQDAHRLAAALIALIDGARHQVNPDGASEVVRLITGHVGCPLAEMPNVSTRFDTWDHINLHRGVQAYLERWSPDAEWFGITGNLHGHADLLDMLAMADRSGAYRLGAVDYATAAAGPDEAVEIVHFGLVRTEAPNGKQVVLAMRGPIEHRPDSGCELRVLAADRETGTAVRTEIEPLVREHDVYRGQLLSFDLSEHRGNELVSFLPRPVLDAHDVVLPSGVLEAIERHVVRSAAQADRLRGHGQHLKRGVMLYGPPGTGKTHTVRYLMSRLSGRTVLLLSGRALVRMLGRAVSMARRLQPSVVVLEDIDLVAEERGAVGSSPVLYELLNRIDGVDADADVTFLLTTNRVDTIERALSERPGRVDLAVEIPKPDADGRERLLRLYAEAADLVLPDASRLVADTDGVTASFMRELVRRTVSEQLDRVGVDERVRLTEPMLREALDELLDQRNKLTRVIIGGR